MCESVTKGDCDSLEASSRPPKRLAFTNPGDVGIWLANDINIAMVGVQNYYMKAKQYCEACGRGDVVSDKMVPQAQLAVSAPRKYELIRHDARKKQ